MERIAAIGIDLARSVFQIHGVDSDAAIVLRRKLRRNHVLPFLAELPPCLTGLEACAGAHYWARELIALGLEAHIMPTACVQPDVKRGKTEGEA